MPRAKQMIAGTIAIAAAISAAQVMAQRAPASGSPAGNWTTDDGRAVISIGGCPGNAAQLCGRISRFLVPEPAGGARDTNNPDRALRSRPLMGVQVLSGLTRSGNSAQWTGRGYSPEEGRNFNATVTADGNRLNVRGCVAIFCRTVVWTRSR